MDSFTWDFPYPSRRMPVMADNVVATSQPLAVQAGLRMLAKDGNAVDAALAAAITLTVVEPTSNGLGSDAFALVWDGEELHGVNGSGRSPEAWSPDHFSKYQEMPLLGWDAVTVPGAVSAWVELSEWFGKLPFRELFKPAMHYAKYGFPVSPITAQVWKLAEERYRDFPEFAKVFLPNGRAPLPGDIFRNPALGRSLAEIGLSRGRTFYRGNLAKKIAAHAQETGGGLTHGDLMSHSVEVVDPLSLDYRGHTLHELPPNGQGLAAQQALGILENFPLDQLPVDSPESIHLQAEAMKLAFADAHRHIADPESMELDPKSLLERSYLVERAALIDPNQAQNPGHGQPTGSDTVYLTTADKAGMMVSFIQSNYRGFGSGIVVPDTGIALQNRGNGFVLTEGHPNRVDGGKRPYHTIIPAFLSKGGAPVMSFGVMGGPFQPQGHLQLLSRMLDHNQNPQAAIDAPRWQVLEGMELAVEPGFSKDALKGLAERGHRVTTDRNYWQFGGAQAIYKLEKGYCAASDPRKDGQAGGF